VVGRREERNGSDFHPAGERVALWRWSSKRPQLQQAVEYRREESLQQQVDFVRLLRPRADFLRLCRIRPGNPAAAMLARRLDYGRKCFLFWNHPF